VYLSLQIYFAVDLFIMFTMEDVLNLNKEVNTPSISYMTSELHQPNSTVDQNKVVVGCFQWLPGLAKGKGE
jgi:uridine kinase